MIKHLLLLVAVPVLSCASTKTTESVIVPVSESGSIVKSKINATIVKNVNETTVVIERINHKQWDELLQKHVTPQGNVNYKGFKEDEEAFLGYLDMLKNNHPDQRTWSRAEIMAYWINAYNAFTVKLIIDHYPLESIKDIDNPWDQEFIKIGKHNYSLGNIEHDILRKMGDSRIHFAINCASYSCPNLLNKAFTAPKLESQLTMVTKNFLADTTKNTISEKKVEVSKIFSWFSGDFKEKGTLIDFIDKYSKVEVSPKARVRFKPYNWNLNE